MSDIRSKTEHWGSRFGFIMAAVGSAVGLGNLWRFPFTAGENGGSAFIVVYLICVAALGLPVLIAEYAVGRKGARSAIAGIRHIAETEGKSTAWVAMGWIGVVCATTIVSFYFVVATWVFDFIPQAFSGRFEGMDAAGSAANFARTVGSQLEISLFLAIFIALNVWVVSRGIKRGIERASEILMPAFFIMLVGMVIFALSTGDAAAAAAFLLQPDFSRVGFGMFLSAVGQAFFSIGVGTCLMITYGAYLTRDTQIPRVSGMVAGSDTFVALIAGFAIFPIVFAFGLEPSAGGGLFFVTMPVAFGQMPFGALVGGLFFTLALFAAFTSSISLFEVAVSWLEDQRGIGRVRGAIGLGGLLYLVGLGYIHNGAFIDHADFITGSILLPLGGLLISLFAGYVLSRDSLSSEIGTGWHFDLVRLFLRYVVPIALLFILVFGVLDKLQDQYGLAMPGFLAPVIGANAP